MRRTAMIFLLLTLAMPTSAAIYQCRDADGNLFLTDDPDNLPPECRREDITIREETPEKSGAPPRDRSAGREAPTPEAPGARSDSGTGAGTEETARPGVGQSPGAAPAEADASAPDRTVGDGVGEETPETVENGAETGAGDREPEPADAEGAGPGPQQEEGAEEAAVSTEKVLDRWRSEARELGREYSEAAGAPTGATDSLEAADRLRQSRENIGQFLDRLDASPLTPEEKAAIWQELPPQAIP